MKKYLRVLAMMLALALVLVSCKPAENSGDKDKTSQQDSGKKDGQGKDDKKTEDPVKAYQEQQKKLVIEHDGTPIKGGTFKIGLTMDSPFKGVFSAILYQDAYDWDMMGDTMYHVLDTGADFKLADSGAMKVEFNKDAKTATLKIQDGFKWNDGTPVTAKDIMYNYQIICSKDYTGVRYDDDTINVVGAKEYHDGKADTIKGVTSPDDKTVVIQFQEFYPSIMWGAGIWSSPINYNQVKDIPIKDLESSEAVRLKPMSCGPFVISKVVAGESVEFVPNEHFWGGKPKLDKIVYEVVPSSNVLASLKSGKYDMVTSIPATIIDEVDNIPGYTTYQFPAMWYNYTGFKLGKWDKEKGECVVDPNAKMSDPKLRKAMAHAVNREAISQNFYKGTRVLATSLIIPAFLNFHNFDAKGYEYNPELSKKLLDEAGYKDVDGDGIREDKNGQKFVINFASMAGGEIAEPLTEYERQCWKEVGLDVQLTTGRLIEFQAFYEKVQADDPEIDMWEAAWGTGSDPNPNGLYSKRAQFNFSRYSDEKIDKALKTISSPEGFDDAKLKQAYKDFDAAMFEACPVYPIFYRNSKNLINKRVKKWDASFQLGDNDDFRWNELELTAEQPITQ